MSVFSLGAVRIRVSLSMYARKLTTHLRSSKPSQGVRVGLATSTPAVWLLVSVLVQSLQ